MGERLRELAQQRGERGISSLICEALEGYLADQPAGTNA
jgi:hypothetical protein